MTLVLTGRNYMAGSDEVSVFGHNHLRVNDDEDMLIDFRPMVEDIVRQIVDKNDTSMSFRINISPRLAAMMLANKATMCRRHFATALEGDDYIEIKRFFDVDGHMVDLWVLRDMENDLELKVNDDHISVDVFSSLGSC